MSGLQNYCTVVFPRCKSLVNPVPLGLSLRKFQVKLT